MDCSVTQYAAQAARPSASTAWSFARDVIAREVQHHPAEKPILAWQAAARALVVRELLLQESRAARHRGRAAARCRRAPRDRRGSVDARR